MLDMPYISPRVGDFLLCGLIKPIPTVYSG